MVGLRRLLVLVFMHGCFSLPEFGDYSSPYDAGPDICVPQCQFKQCGPDGCGGTCGQCGEDQLCSNGGCDSPWVALEVFDDANNATLNPCHTSALATPGADIDAAELDSSGVIAQLDVCAGPLSTGSCSNDMVNASSAEGGPDGDPENGFVSLNGGFIRCNWDSGAAARSGSGQVITIYEIGGATGGILEQYGVRLCKGTSGNCIKNSGYVSGTSLLQADALF